MAAQRSNGSKLGGGAGAVITAAFFLPWIRACNNEMSGYEIATNKYGNVQDPWVYWLTLIVGLFCLALFLFVKNTNPRVRIATAVTRLVTGLVGFLPLVNIWNNVQQRSTTMEILYGGWLIAAGYAAVFLSFFLDLFGPNDEPP